VTDLIDSGSLSVTSSLRTGYRDLLEAPRSPTTSQVWKAMSKPERVRALWHLLADPLLSDAFRGPVLRGLHLAGGFRIQALERLSPLELADRAAVKCSPAVLPVEAALREVHLRDRRPLLCAFLEALGLPHQNNGTVEAANLPDADVTPSKVSEAVAVLAPSLPI